MSANHPGQPNPGGCRAREVLELIADKWSLYVVSCLGPGPRRFTELKRGIDGISQRMLTVTLRGLERDGILTRTVYQVMPPHALGKDSSTYTAAARPGTVHGIPASTKPRPPRNRP